MATRLEQRSKRRHQNVTQAARYARRDKRLLHPFDHFNHQSLAVPPIKQGEH